jgi:hypothetical protein
MRHVTRMLQFVTPLQDSSWFVPYGACSSVDRACHGWEKVVGSLLVLSSSINPTILADLLLGGYSMSASCDALFFYVASTYWKPSSTTPPLELPLVGTRTFFEVMMSFL